MSNLFDQRHLVKLYIDDLISELPYELGPMPLVDCGTSVTDDLIAWGVINPETRQLTPAAAELFAGICNYEWAVWGVLLLYNERQKMRIDLPSEMLQWGVQYAIRDIPRVTFLISVKAGVVTTVTMAGGALDISVDDAQHDTNAQIAAHLMKIMDPEEVFPPYPMTEVSLPEWLQSSLAKKRATTDADVLTSVCQTRQAITQAGIWLPTAHTIAELLQQQNVASAQLCLTRRSVLGKHTAKSNAAGVLFLTGEKHGVVVSYPRKAVDDSTWIAYESGTKAALTRAITALHDGLNTVAA